MTLSQLRYAVAVDAHRHFGRAAEACFVSQPTLSVGLQKLEAELGVTIFDRSRQPVVPTEAGLEALARARAVLREADALAGLGAPGEPAGELRLGVIPTVAASLLPLVAGPFAERVPRATLSVREWTTSAVRAALEAGQIDAGVVATDEAGADLHAEVLYEEAFVAYVGGGFEDAAEVACDRLAPDEVWLLGEGHCFRDQVLALCGAARGGAERRVRFESGSLETLRRMVDRSGGVTLLPELSTRYLSGAEVARIRPLAAPAPRRTVRLLTSRARPQQALAAAFAETVREAVADAWA